MSAVLPRALVSAAVAALVFVAAWRLSDATSIGRELAFSLLAGAAFGVILQRSRFCFFCNLRDLVERRDPRGILSILVALGTGVVLYHAVIMSWLPVPNPDLLPPDAHIGPVSLALPLAALVFGVGMSISGSCLSAHIYRLGEGSPTSPFALLGALVGFGLGFLTWNGLYLALVSDGAALWLPHHLGYGPTVLLSLLALAGLAALALAWGRNRPADPAAEAGVLRQIFVHRWPAALGGLAVAAVSAIAYLRVAPLGVTAELGSLSRTAGADLGLLPETLYGLDGLRGCATVVKEALLSNNGLFVMGIVAGSFAAALPAGAFRPEIPRPRHVVRGLVGGVLMGWGAMIGLGCTVGVLLSGIHAGAVSGWVFLVAVTLGVLVSLRLAPRVAAA